MIVEIRTYDVPVGGVAGFERQFEAQLGRRGDASHLMASWHTEIGPLNRIMQLWSYASLLQRDTLYPAGTDPGLRPMGTSVRVIAQSAATIEPAAFSPPLQPSEHGVYEIRSYTVKGGALPDIAAQWAPLIARRMKYSPLVLAGGSISSDAHRWISIWGYADLNQRSRIRREVVAAGVWPPPPADFLLAQETAIVLPAEFSPLR